MVDCSFKYKAKQKTKAMYLCSIWVLLLLVFAVGPTLAAKPDRSSGEGSFKAWLELKEEGPYYVGDSISVNLIMEGLSGTEYSLSELNNKQLDGLELSAQGRVEQEELQGGWKHTISYRLVGWSAGEYQISGVTVNYQDQNGNKGSILLKELSIKITSLLPTNLSEAEILADGLKSLKKPVGLPPRYQYIWFLLGGLVILVIVYWLLKYLKDNYQSKVAVSQGPNIVKLEPAHLIALHRLEDLRSQQLLEEGKYKVFYDRLSEIAREYMENRFQVRALEMTTEEFLVSLGKKDFLNSAQKKALTEFLQYSDLVKFAKHEPIREEGERALAIIYGLIEETKEEVENEI